jgi:hypothetical protein
LQRRVLRQERMRQGQVLKRMVLEWPSWMMKELQ